MPVDLIEQLERRTLRDATLIGSTITVYKNGNQVMQVSDPTWSDGNPGMAMFIRPGGTPKNYCYTQFTAGSL